MLEQEDREIIKTLGLKFRGRQDWPLFRSYRPYCMPWFLTADEAAYLTVALQQAVLVAERFEEDRQLFDPPEAGQYFVRVPRTTDTGIEWEDAWMTPPPMEHPAGTAIVAITPKRLMKLQAAAKRADAICEVGTFPMPGPVCEGNERPYFPVITFYVDHDSGAVIHFHMARAEQHAAEVLDDMLGFFEKARAYPAQIHVSQSEVYDLLQPIAEALGISLHRVKMLPMLKEAKAFLKWSFANMR